MFNDNTDILAIAAMVTMCIFVIIWSIAMVARLNDLQELIEDRLEPSVTCIEKDGKRYCEVADEEL